MDATHAFCCECQTHLGHLLVNAEVYCYRGTQLDFRVVGIADDVVQIATNLWIEELRELMGTVTGGHVMVETVNYVEEFNGERLTLSSRPQYPSWLTWPDAG